jgi:N-methylhydantoinase A
MRIGIDTGGTFTDFVVVRDGRMEVFKKFSTPREPEAAILEGLHGLEPTEVIHGSTVATNALLERKGARVALLTTEGFEDVLAIGRQTRRELYNIFVRRPDPLVPFELRFGVKERTLYDGAIDQSLDLDHLHTLVAALQRNGVQAAAVCLLFSFANNKHEEAVAEMLAPLGIPVSLSCRVLAEYREYERTSTTVINAYLAPLMGSYLNRLGGHLGKTRLRVMQSNGGAVRARTAADLPVHTIVSGPAGGVVGAFHVASACGYSNIITFDMGGTSTTLRFVKVESALRTRLRSMGCPSAFRLSTFTRWVRAAVPLRNSTRGERSRSDRQAQARILGRCVMGKVASVLPVTDANVALGRLPARFFLGGTVPLAVDRIAPAVSRMPWTRQWNSLHTIAQGVIDVVNNNMEQAIRLISIERGYDPRDFALVSFGGAGGLHAADLARALSIPRVVVPRHPGALSALGLLLSDVRKDYSRSMLIPAAGAEARVRRELESLHRAGRADLKDEGFEGKSVRILDSLDLRYRGQSYELTVPFARAFVSSFHKLHERRYGHSDAARAVEIVNVRSTFFGRAPKIRFPKMPKARGKPQPLEVISVWFTGKAQRTSVYDRSGLQHGHVLRGPAIVGEYSSTTLVPPDFVCEVDALGIWC